MRYLRERTAAPWGALQRAAVGLVALALASTSSAEAFDRSDLKPSDLKGIWHVENSAEFIEVTDTEASYFDATSVSCIPTDRGPLATLSVRFGGGLVSRKRNALTLADRTGYPYQLKRMHRLPARCRNGGTVGNDPVLNFETFFAYFKENYAGDAARQLDWESIHDTWRTRVTPATTANQLWAIYASILRGFDDVHVFMSNGKQGEEARSISAGKASGLRKALHAQDAELSEDDGFARDAEVANALNTMILHDVLDGKFRTALNGKFQWGWAAPHVGYLNIRQMSGLFAVPATDPKAVDAAVHEAMRAVLADFRDARAMVIDIRQNRGGAAAVGEVVASYFGDRAVSLRSRTRTPAGFTAWRKVPVVPDASVNFAGPVYLLVSGNTVSAAEQFAAVMQSYPAVTLVGTRTRGALSDILVKRMPDGSLLGLSDVQLLSPSGAPLETIGVAPNVVVESYDPQCLVTCFAKPVDVAVKLASKRNP